MRKSNGVPVSVVMVLVIMVGVGVWFVATMMNGPASPLPEATTTPSQVATTTQMVGTSTTQQEPLSARVAVLSPGPGGVVDKTFTVTGKAPGPWFSEAQFPIQVRNANGDIIGDGSAHTDGNWQSDDVVPFTADVTISDPTYKGAVRLILMRDNPSGMPENDDAVEIPIVIR